MYENNDPNTENNESSTYRYTPERGTQNDYTAGAHNADSQYSSGPQSGCIPGSYSYSPEPPKKKKKLSAGKIIAIALACALLGGCLGVGATLLLRNNTENQTPSTGTTMYVGERQTEKVNTARTDTSEKLTPREVYAQNVNSTVGITTSITTNYWGYQTTSAASGSGFILTEDGYILTNYHVIENSSSVQVTTYDNTAYSASIVGYDKSNDIAVLKIDATGLTPVVLGSSDDLYVGDEVMAIGNPLGELTFSLTVGYVSALDRAGHALLRHNDGSHPDRRRHQLRQLRRRALQQLRRGRRHHERQVQLLLFFGQRVHRQHRLCHPDQPREEHHHEHH